MTNFIKELFKRKRAFDVIVGVVITIISTIILSFSPSVKSFLLQKINTPFFVLILIVLIIFIFTILGCIRYFKNTIEKLKEDASRDRFLTKAYSKDQAERLLNNRIEDAITSGKSFSVIFLDIDDFKKINEEHGHDDADFILEQFAERIEPRSKDEYFIRNGGDEFLIITKLTDPRGAGIEGNGFANRIKNDVKNDPFLLKRGKGEKYNLTISCGVAEYLKKDTFHTIINRAESAMREAKKTKNFVILAEKKLLSA